MRYVARAGHHLSFATQHLVLEMRVIQYGTTSNLISSAGIDMQYSTEL